MRLLVVLLIGAAIVIFDPVRLLHTRFASNTAIVVALGAAVFFYVSIRMAAS